MQRLTHLSLGNLLIMTGQNKIGKRGIIFLTKIEMPELKSFYLCSFYIIHRKFINWG